MSLSHFSALLALAGVLFTVASPVAEAAKTSKRRTVIASKHRYSLVPPPPAYMPTILPELYYRGGVQSASVAAPVKTEENPLTKYVYQRSGEEVKGVSSRKGVVNWAPLRVKKPS